MSGLHLSLIKNWANSFDVSCSVNGRQLPGCCDVYANDRKLVESSHLDIVAPHLLRGLAFLCLMSVKASLAPCQARGDKFVVKNRLSLPFRHPKNNLPMPLLQRYDRQAELLEHCHIGERGFGLHGA
jgi:hypothetical protein